MARSALSKQLLVATETQEGTAPADLATNIAYGGIPYNEVTLTPAPTFLGNTPLTQFITPVSDTVALVPATYNHTLNMQGTTGGAFGDGAPPWYRLAEAAGFRQYAFQECELATVAGTILGGPFRHGELIQAAGGVGRVVHDTWDGAPKIYFEVISGTIGAEAITGLSSGATVTTATAGADAGFGLSPVSTIEKSVDLAAAIGAEAVLVGDVIRGVVSRAVAIVSRDSDTADTQIFFAPDTGRFQDGEAIERISGTAFGANPTLGTPTNEAFTAMSSIAVRLNEAGIYKDMAGARLNMSMALESGGAGVLTFAGNGSFLGEGDTAFLAGVAANNSTPPIWRNARVAFGNDGINTYIDEIVDACVQSLQIDMGNQVQQRPCAQSPTGIESNFIGSRSPTGSINPEATAESAFPWVGNVRAGDLFRLRTTLGDALGSMFTMSMPGLQGTQVPTGNRNDILTNELAFNLTGGQLNNLNAATPALASTGGNNELVITYHTTP